MFAAGGQQDCAKQDLTLQLAQHLLGFALLTKFVAHHPMTCPCPRPKVSLLRSPEIMPATLHVENCLHMPQLLQHILECKLLILLQGDTVVTSNSSKKKKTGREGGKTKQCACSLM